MTELTPLARSLLDAERAAPGVPAKVRVSMKAAVMAAASGATIGAGTSYAAKSAWRIGTLWKIGAFAGLAAVALSTLVATRNTPTHLAPSAARRQSTTATIANVEPAPQTVSVSTLRRAAAQDGPRAASSSPREWPPAAAAAPGDDVVKDDMPPPSKLGLLEDARLLQEADRVRLGGDATQSLSLLAQHETQFVHSPLAPERELLRVLALCSLGRQTEAMRIARPLLARGGPQAIRAQSSCIREGR